MPLNKYTKAKQSKLNFHDNEKYYTPGIITIRLEYLKLYNSRKMITIK